MRIGPFGLWETVVLLVVVGVPLAVIIAASRTSVFLRLEGFLSERLPAWVPSTFRGRLSRLRLIGYGLVWSLIFIATYALFGYLIMPLLAIVLPLELVNVLAVAVFLTIYSLYAIGSISLGVRRLHDMGRSGYWLLLSLVPVANIVLALLLLVVPGTDGENRFGWSDMS